MSLSLSLSLSLGNPIFNKGGGGSAPARAGDLVFASQAEATVPSYNVDGGYPAAGAETMATETLLNDMPAGGRIAWFNWWARGDGVVPIERKPGNDAELSWASLFSGQGGAGYRQALSFDGNPSGEMTDGGYALSDPLPAINAGSVIRWTWTVPAGGKRPAGYGLTSWGTPQRAAAALSTFDARKTSGALTLGTVLNNGAALQAAAVLAPLSEGQRSLLIVGTSIERGQDYLSGRVIAWPRYTAGYLNIGLDSEVNDRWGYGNFGAFGASIAKMDDFSADSGEFGLRYKFLNDIRRMNGGRWPFTDILLGFRNDVINVTGSTAEESLDQMWALTLAGLAAYKAAFPAVPIHVVTVPPIVVSGGAPYWCTDLEHQLAGDNRAVAVKMYNERLRTDAVSAGFASLLDVESAWAAPDDGSDFLKWPLTPFTLAGGGTIDAVAHPSGIAAGTNLASAGFTLAAAQAPEVGTYLVFEPGDGTNNEIVSNWPILSATAAGTGKWLVKVALSTTTAKAHAAGAVVKTASTVDRTHPCKILHDDAALIVEAWKATV